MNQLETLLAGVKSNNAAIGGKVAELQTLLRNRDELIADGARLGLKKTVMQAMLFNVKLKLVTGGSEPVQLGDVLPEFPPLTPCDGMIGSAWLDAQRDQTNPMTNGNPGGSNPSTGKSGLVSATDLLDAPGKTFDLSKVAE